MGEAPMKPEGVWTKLKDNIIIGSLSSFFCSFFVLIVVYIFRFTNSFLHYRVGLILLYICCVFMLVIHLYHFMYTDAIHSCFIKGNLTRLMLLRIL